MQVLGTGGKGKESSTVRIHDGSRGESSSPRVTIREKEAAALELLVEAAQVEQGRDGSVTVSRWRGVAEGSAHRAVVRVNLVGEVGLFPHLCNRIGIDWIEEILFFSHLWTWQGMATDQVCVGAVQGGVGREKILGIIL